MYAEFLSELSFRVSVVRPDNTSSVAPLLITVRAGLSGVSRDIVSACD